MRISDWSSDVCSSDLTAHLEPATGALREFAEVVGLENHVIEFEERQRLLAIEPQLDRIEAQHPVDREMLADRAQEGDVFERVEPSGIVEHHRIRWPAAEGGRTGGVRGKRGRERGK